MNILHINTRAMEGGAARACYRLHMALPGQGHCSRIVSRDDVAGRDDLQSWVSASHLWRPVEWLGYKVEYRLGLQGVGNLTSWFGHRRHAAWADVVNLHNLHGFHFSMLLLPRLERAAPLVWALHDMWPLTGHCGYAMDCERWLTGCGKCPDLAMPPPIGTDTTRLLYRARERIYSQISPVLVTPSRWLLGQARRAPLTRKFRSVCIPHGLDTSLFRPIGKEAARKALGLPPEEKVILFCAPDLRVRRKGADLLPDALGRLRAMGLPDVRLLVVGSAADEVARRSPLPAVALGPVGSDHFLAAAYSAADAFVSTSRAETLGLTLIESLACGTPAVAFKTAAIPEVVRPGLTGWLAEPGDVADLARCLGVALNQDEQRRTMAGHCRRIAEEEYDVRLMAKRYANLYEELAEERAGRRPGFCRK